MGKRVFLKEKQIKMLCESLNNDKFNKNLEILSELNPLSIIDSVILKKIITNGYNKSKSNFSDNIEEHSFNEIVNKLNKLILICQKKEEPIKTELSKLCSDMVLSMFELKDCSVELECNLTKDISNTKDFHIKQNDENDIEYESVKQLKNVKYEKIKRSFISAITVGASIAISEKLLKKFMSEIFELDEELPYLYNKIIKINEYLLYLNNEKITDTNNMQGAYENVIISKNDKSVKIKSEGIIFPFLLSETIRGFIEAVSSDSLPDDSSIANEVIDSCDVLEKEPFYMVFGSALWKKITDDNEIDFNEYEAFLDILFKIKTKSFIRLMNEIVNSTKLGKDNIKKILQKVKYKNEYNDFEKSLKKKRLEKSLLYDEYLNEEDLE